MEYKKIRRLGQGGMGEVWLVSNDKTRHYYAAKFLNQNLSRSKDRVRFTREITALQSFNHPCIVKIYDIIDKVDSLGYIMEYCPDGDLEMYLSNNPFTDPTPFIHQLIRAVEYIHMNSWIHRDIKPSNILVGPDRRIRLSDLGLVIPQNPCRTIVTTSNWFSQGFAAPEQYQDMASVTLKADVFSIGAVWYYFLTKRLFDITKSLDQQADDLNELQYPILANLLALDPNDRCPSSQLIKLFYPTNFPKARSYFEAGKEYRPQHLQKFNELVTNNHWEVDEWIEIQQAIGVIQKYERDASLAEKANQLYQWMIEEGKLRFVD